MAFTVYNVLIFLGQMLMGKSGVMVASIMEALMPMISICILWGYKHVKPKKVYDNEHAYRFYRGCICYYKR